MTLATPRAFALTLLVAASLLAAACGDPRTRTARPQLVPPLEMLDFGPVPVLNEKLATVDVLNVGRATLRIEDVRITESSVPFTVKTRPEEVVAGETQVIELSFVPPVEGDYTATLVLQTEDLENPLVEVKLSGKGSTRAIMEVEPTALAYGRVAECTSVVKTLTLRSKGSADLVIQEIAFTEGTSPAFSFVGSTKTPAVVKTVAANGLPGQIQLTVKYAAAAGTTEPASGGIRIRATDPDNREVVIPLSALVNRAPVAVIAPLGNGAPGLDIPLDGAASDDPDADAPLAFKWTLRSKPLASVTEIIAPTQAATSMKLDPAVPGEYEVELNVTDATGAKNCAPARAKVVAAPAQKLLIEMFWDNSKTDLDLHVLRTTTSEVSKAPDDCHYANPKPDWGVAGDTADDPEFLRDALTGYGPELLGYVNPVETSYRIVVEFAHDHLQPSPASAVTVRVYQFGVVKAEFKKTLEKRGEFWSVADVAWPSGTITQLQ